MEIDSIVVEKLSRIIAPPIIKYWSPCTCGNKYFYKSNQRKKDTFRPKIWRHRFQCIGCKENKYSDWQHSWSTGGGGVFLAHQYNEEIV